MKFTPRGLNGIVALAITLCIVASLTGARAADDKTTGLKCAIVDSSRLTTESRKAEALRTYVTKADADATVELRFYAQNPLLSQAEQEEGAKLALAQAAPNADPAGATRLKQLTDKNTNLMKQFDDLKNTAPANMTPDKSQQLKDDVNAGQATQERINALKNNRQQQVQQEVTNREKALVKEIRDAIAKVAKEKGFNLVFNADVCLYAETDVTNDVLKALDK
jgi:Skp family chaperone for outer membrane proteins